MEAVLNFNNHFPIKLKSTKVEDNPIIIYEITNVKLLLKMNSVLVRINQIYIITKQKLTNTFSNKMRKALCLKCTNSLY
jgi:hypothetical protein